MRTRGWAVGAVIAAVLVAAGLLAGCKAAPTVLSGHLTVAGSAAPASGVPVTVYADATDTVVATTATDATGAYAFDSTTLPDGNYRLRLGDADWWQAATDWTDSTTVAVASTTNLVIDDTLAAGSITGTVTDNGGPVNGATATATSATTGQTVATTTTGTDGTYTFVALPVGDYHVRFTATGDTSRYSGGALTAATAPTVTVANSATTAGIDATLAPESTITGTAFNGLNDEPGFYMVVTDLADISVLALDPASGETLASATTGANGAFTLHGLEHTGYVLMFVDPQGNMHTLLYGSTTLDRPSGTVVTPPAGGTSDVGSVAMVGKDCGEVTFAPGADLSGTNLAGCTVTGDLTGADLSGAVLTNTYFNGADLSGADLTGANLGGVDLASSVLTGVRSGANTGFPYALPINWHFDLGYLIGPGTDLSGKDLAGLSDPGANLAGANLAASDLTGANLSSATLTGANLAGTDLTGATLDYVRSGGITGTPAALPTNWSLAGGYLLGPNANLRSADLTGADLTGAYLSTADLTNAILTGANITGTNFGTSAYLMAGVRSGGLVGTPSNLATSFTVRDGYFLGPQVDLSGADLSGLDISGTQLQRREPHRYRPHRRRPHRY